MEKENVQLQSVANQTTKDDWLDSILTLLESVDYGYIQSCSISIVPEGLKQSNEDAYLPRVVCIGPRFKGRREDLLLMEEVKLRCMLSLIHRAGEKNEAGEYLKKCSDAVWELDEEVRASYAADINLEQHELAKIMLVDGCFLLELLISKDMDTQTQLRSRLSGPAPEVLKNDDVLSDLMLLENQIPIFVLHKLSQILFPDLFEPDREEQQKDKKEEQRNREEEQRDKKEEQRDENEEQRKREEEHRDEKEEQRKKEEEQRKRKEKLREEKEEQRKRERRAKRINNLSLSVLGYSLTQFRSFESPHILDLVHCFVNRKGESETGSTNGNHVVGIMDTQQVELKLKRCASRLQAAGVKIKLAQNTDSALSCFGLLRNCFGGIFIWFGNLIVTTRQVDMPAYEGTGLDFDIKFEKGKLIISQLHITKTTKAKWRNVIAWEHHKKNQRSSSSGKFTSSALIFDGLICCAADLKLLKEKKIIVDHVKMSNDELEAFFRTMSFGVDHRVVDSSYFRMVDDLNNYSTTFFIARMWKILWHVFTYRLEWCIKFMRKNYNFVAAVLAVLSVVQTVYGILAYQFPK